VPAALDAGFAPVMSWSDHVAPLALSGAAPHARHVDSNDQNWRLPMTTKTTRLTLLSTAATIMIAFAAPAFAANAVDTAPHAIAAAPIAQADYYYHHHHYHHRRHEHGHWIYF
jgi:hypothetical protein